MTQLLELALETATKAHMGQYYGTGEPYIVHPKQVADLAKRLGYSDYVIAACYLHDVVEDTGLTEKDLANLFPKKVVQGVVAVTYTGQDTTEKIRQSMENPISHVVKFCDASCNYANAILNGTKVGKDPKEVIPRRALYIATLLKELPSPVTVNKYVHDSQLDKVL